MASIEVLKPVCVAGFVKGGTSNKDNSVTFRVARQKFIVKEGSAHHQQLASAERALVQFVISDTKNPKILHIFNDPSARMVMQYSQS